MNEIALITRLAAVGRLVLGSFFLYLCSQLFHAKSDLMQSAKKPWHKVFARVFGAFMGAVAIAFVMVIWTGV